MEHPPGRIDDLILAEKVSTEKPPSKKGRNFVKDNILKVTMMEPRKPQPTYVDTNRGHKELLEDSGLVAKYIKKKDYGETPEYLQRLMEEQRRAREEHDRHVSDRMREGAMKQLSGEEHAAILEGLSQNWEDLNRQYQGLPMVTDTIGKRHRRLCLEQALLQLEKDIALMKRYQTIYIAHD